MFINAKRSFIISAYNPRRFLIFILVFVLGGSLMMSSVEAAEPGGVKAYLPYLDGLVEETDTYDLTTMPEVQAIGGLKNTEDVLFPETLIGLTPDGDLYGIGEENAMLGDVNEELTSTASAIQIQGISDVTQIQVTNDAVFALKSDGSVWSWGNNAFLGRETSSEQDGSFRTPTQIPNLPPITSMSIFHERRILLDVNGHTWQWGQNTKIVTSGESGFAREDVHIPEQAVELENIVKVAAGSGSFAAVDQQGNVYEWAGKTADIESGNFPLITDPTQVNISNIVDIKTVTYGFYATNDQGELYFWGSDHKGVGIDTSGWPVAGQPYTHTPVQVTGIPPVAHLSTANSNYVQSAIMLGQDGSVYAWGKLIFGNLDGPLIAASDIPVRLTDPMNQTVFDGAFAEGGVPLANPLLVEMVGESMVVTVQGEVNTEQCEGVDVTIAGTEDDDILTGTAGVDVIHGLGGNDVIKGLEGEDIICGGDGDDHIDGGTQKDNINGGKGHDTIYGRAGADRLFGGAGDDIVRGNSGNDYIRSGNGFDTVDGGNGNDNINAGRGNDTIDGGNGDDTLKGGLGTDVLRGSEGSDTCDGELVEECELSI